MDFDRTWQECQQTLRQLQQKTMALREVGHARKLLSSQEYVSTYQKIYGLCIIHNSNNPEMLYKKFVQVCIEYMAEIRLLLQDAKDLLLLKQYRNMWNCYRLFLKPCRNLFAYLDKFHVPQNNQMLLQKKGLTIFCQTMFESELFETTQFIYIREVEKIRQTEDFGSCGTLKDFIEILQDINALQRVCDSQLASLERRYVDSAGEYYRRKYRELEKLSCGEYLSAVSELYQRELNLFDKCFDVTSALDTLNKRFSQELVRKYKTSLLQKSTGMLWMLENQQAESLRLLNDLYRRLDNFEDLRAKFAQYVTKNLQEHLDRNRQQFPFDTEHSQQRVKNQMQFIRSVFKFHKDQSRQLDECFPNNQQFQLSYKFAIEGVFNNCNRSYSISDILALYTDSIIRDKKLEQEAFEEEMKHIFNIFSCLVDKDMFIKSYMQLLAKRLINDSYSNLDFETTFKSKLKEVCGVISVQPIDNLLSDFNVSQKECENFSKYLLDKHKREDFRVRLLSRGIWPTEQPLELELFDELHNYNTLFNQYFQDHFKFKTFKWSHLQSRVIFTYFIHDSLKATSKYEQYDLNMNGLQAALLYFIYRKRGEYLVGESFLVQQFAKVPPELLLGSLKILTSKNINVIKLVRNEQSGENLYEFNGMLQPKRKCLVYEDFTKQTEQRRWEEVESDRSLAVSMAIVKVMKARRRLKFDLLVSEVAQILRNFQPSIRLIKQSIEKMVQKDYLQRDPKDISEYRYKE